MCIIGLCGVCVTTTMTMNKLTNFNVNFVLAPRLSLCERSFSFDIIRALFANKIRFLAGTSFLQQKFIFSIQLVDSFYLQQKVLWKFFNSSNFHFYYFPSAFANILFTMGNKFEKIIHGIVGVDNLQ